MRKSTIWITVAIVLAVVSVGSRTVGILIHQEIPWELMGMGFGILTLAAFFQAVVTVMHEGKVGRAHDADNMK